MRSPRRHLIRYTFLTVCFVVGLTLDLWIGHLPGLPTAIGTIAQAQAPTHMVQAGVDAYAAGDYQAAIDQWQVALNAYQGNMGDEQAIIQTNLARAYQQLGQPEAALEHLDGVATTYEGLNMLPQLGRIKTEQAQIYTRLGQYRRAIALLCLPPDSAASAANPEAIIQNCATDGAYPIAIAAEDLDGQAAALGSLGNAYRLKGDYDQAIAILGKGLSLSGQRAYQIPMLTSLGNTYGRQALVSYQRAESAENLTFPSTAQDFQAIGDRQFQTAIDHLTKALTLAQQRHEPMDQGGSDKRQQTRDLIDEMHIHLSLLKLYQRSASVPDLAPTQQRLGQLLADLPASRETAYGAISLAKSYQTQFGALSCFTPGSESLVQTWLNNAQTIASQINDHRAQSFATGTLGHFYECQGEGSFDRALTLTRAAEYQAEEGVASADSQYLWQWQAGRIYEMQGNQNQALEHYHRAIQTLDTIRDDILTATQDLQFDFRDAVEPLYRNMIWLQLRLSEQKAAAKQTKPGATEPSLVSLKEALATVDSLKLAELQNYFGDDCLLSPIPKAQADELINQNQTSAVISTITFPEKEKTALILSLPGATPRLRWINTDSETLRTTVNQYLEELERYKFDFTYDNSFATQLYDWMIAPLKPALENANVDTLVFIQDGILRSIPMAALSDGDHFLIEEFAIATTPSLTLTDPQVLRRDGLKVLALGFSDGLCEDGKNCQYPPIVNVEKEIAAVREVFPQSPPALLNREFTAEKLANALQGNSYPVLHIATHGKFSTDPDNTFIVTGAGEKLTFGDLEQLIRENSSNLDPIELIALTACETGVGDDRSTLGLGGVAIRAGARSAIASLWLIDDAATANIMGDFYRNLKEDSTLNKAQALQKAQIAAIQPGASPGNWAPLVLVGNWL